MLSVATPSHAEQLRLDMINTQEGLIASNLDSLVGADPKHSYTKETQAMLKSAMEEKASLISHYNEVFGKNYKTELNQEIKNYTHAKELSEMHLTEEFRIGCMHSEEEAKQTSDYYANLAKGYAEVLESKFNHTV